MVSGGRRFIIGRTYSVTSNTAEHSGHITVTVHHYRVTPRRDTFTFTRVEDAREFADKLIAQVKASDWGLR